VAIHLILYVREVYPSGIFQKRKKYNVPVQVRFFKIDDSSVMYSFWTSYNIAQVVLKGRNGFTTYI